MYRPLCSLFKQFIQSGEISPNLVTLIKCKIYTLRSTLSDQI